MEKIPRKIFTKIFNLYKYQDWLKNRENSLFELIDLFNNLKQQEFVLDLLMNFRFMNGETFNEALESIVKFIITQENYTESTTQIVPLSNDPSPDSSDQIIHGIRSKLTKNSWNNVKLSNRLGEAVKNYKSGKKNIIIVDEFLGTGKTLIRLYRWLQNELEGEYKIKVAYIAGISYYIEKVRQQGIEIFCAIPLKRGISDYFEDTLSNEYKSLMIDMEFEYLENTINNKKLIDYSLGFNKAEALYSAEACGGNTPNSVFPILWWPKLKGNRDNNTLLFRNEEGF
jgi:hypothetical protein